MEKQLINELIEGNQEAFKLLVEQHQDRVTNTCYGFVHDADDADDLTQDVFIEVFHSIGKFKQDSSISTWIYRIAVNKSLDFIKKHKRIKRWGSVTRISTESEDIKDSWIGHSETPEASLEQKERILILNTAIDKLPTNQKTAFTLHKYEELSYKEISIIMSSSISSVESLLHRAKKNLKIKLEKYYKQEML